MPLFGETFKVLSNVCVLNACIFMSLSLSSLCKGVDSFLILNLPFFYSQFHLCGQ